MSRKRALVEVDLNVARSSPLNKSAKTKQDHADLIEPVSHSRSEDKGNIRPSKPIWIFGKVDDELTDPILRLMQPLSKRQKLIPTTRVQDACIVGVRAEKLTREHMTYGTKDNSKLRLFLLDRDLPTNGTREELIARLESTAINYEDLPSGKITKMLQHRQVRNAATGPKAAKIQRLRINDALDWDTANPEEGMLYGTLMAHKDALEYAIAEKKAVSAGNMDAGQIAARLTRRKLSQSGSNAEKRDRLWESILEDVKKATEEYERRRADLETRIGHPFKSMDV